MVRSHFFIENTVLFVALGGGEACCCRRGLFSGGAFVAFAVEVSPRMVLTSEIRSTRAIGDASQTATTLNDGPLLLRFAAVWWGEQRGGRENVPLTVFEWEEEDDGDGGGF